jgi:hypothetical protein
MAYAVVDRFEGAYAVLTIEGQQGSLDIPRQQLPPGVREGHWLLVEIVDGQLISAQIDETATQAARQRIQDKIERLRRGEHLK